jgi:hypothetical protein
MTVYAMAGKAKRMFLYVYEFRSHPSNFARNSTHESPDVQIGSKAEQNSRSAI